MYNIEIMFKCQGDQLAAVYEVMKQTGMSYRDILLYGAEQLRKESGMRPHGSSPCVCAIEPFNKD